LKIFDGMSTNLPAFNFREVIEVTIGLMKNPKMNVVLIPDSPTGADIIETDFGRLCNRGKGSYMQRCTYEIDPEANIITITSLPDTIFADGIRSKVVDIKERNGLPEIVSMNDLSGKKINMEFILRDDVNPYKFIKKLIKEIAGLEKVYPVNVTVSNDYQSIDYSIKDLLLEWIRYRREQKRTVLTNKRQRLFSEQRINDIKIFILNKDNLEETIKIFRTSRNLEEIQKNLLQRYHNTPVQMDSVQAKTLSNMRFHELSIESYEKCLSRRDEILEELNEVEETLNSKDGVDKVIIAELRDGIKRFGTDRRSNVVPYNIDITSDHEGYCVLQLSGDGNITRRIATNADEEPIPLDTNGFAVLIDNESAFILIDDLGYHSFIRSKDIPFDTEVPVNRYLKKPLHGKIIAMLPAGSDKCCTLVSKKGIMKRIIISDLVPSKKPCISLDDNDRLVKGLVFNQNSVKELLIYTKLGFGQRVDNNSIRITSPSAKGMPGFKFRKDDEIIGIFSISPEENEYLLYTTIKGKSRLNNIKYLPIRESKHDKMVSLISLPDRDKLFSVIGCNKYDKATLFFADGTSEDININKIKESTMSEPPKKYVKKDMVPTSSNVVKVKLY
jgi:DNA topoisomerase IV subunit A